MVTTLVLVVAFLALEFRSPLLLLTPIREWYIKKLIVSTQKQQQLDMQELWQLRDRLGATITYNQDYLEPHSILQFKHIPDSTVRLFSYQGHGVTSEEYLVSATASASLIDPQGDTLYQDAATTITVDRFSHVVHIYTALPFTDMKKHNGMIDYNETKQDLSNKIWVTQTAFIVSSGFTIH